MLEPNTADILENKVLDKIIKIVGIVNHGSGNCCGGKSARLRSWDGTS